MIKNKTVHMVYICDSKYAEPTMVSVCSAISNKHKHTKLDITIISTGLSAVECFHFEKFNKYNVCIKVLNVENCFNKINTNHRHVSKAAMLKFKLATFFPKLSKILYIDGDTIIQHDLLELYNTDLNNTYVGAVPDLLGMVKYEHHLRLDLEKYFNSGVMLLNLEAIRKEGLETKLLENKLNDKWKYFMDQDALNQTFNGNVTWLTPRYNVMMQNDNKAQISFEDKAKVHNLTADELWHAYDDAVIVHLSDGFKPWDHIEAWDYNLWNLYRRKAQKILKHKGIIDFKISNNGKKRVRLLGRSLFSWYPKTKYVKLEGDFEGLKLCFYEYGGVGDCLLILPLLEQIYKQSPVDIHIDFYCRFPDLCKEFEFLNYVGDRTPVEELEKQGYDAVFQVIRYARFISGNREKIKHEYPLLDKYIEMDEKIAKIGEVRNSLRLFNDFALSMGKKRADQADLFDIFNADYNKFPGLQIENKEDILKKYGLIAQNYITINRGCDGVYNENHPKLWPLDYYNKLIELIHEQYPSLNIVQVGKDDKFGIMQGINKNLVGKTNFEEIATVIKNAIIHIDVEGGLVHLNHFVHGKSLVLFGPTSMEIYAYPENVNIKGTCPLGNCYNVVPNWAEKCILDTKCTCMRSITPDMVFEKLNTLLTSMSQTWYKIVDRSTEKPFYYVPNNILAMHLPTLPAAKMFMFDIDKALELFPSVKRFGLVFFMGIGDYFYATSFIEQLKKKYSKIHFDAYVSKNFDGNNSPLVADCLKTNPNIEHVYLYDGIRNPNYSFSYDYSDVYNMTDDKTLVLPMVYFHTDKTPSRLNALCKVFGLDIPEINLKPIIYNYKPSKVVQTAFNIINKTDKKVVFMQTQTRSTDYHYRYTNTIVKMLLKEGFFVITPENVKIKSDSLYVINTKKFKITDSIALLKQIKEDGKDIYVFTFASCFPSIAAALDIPCLCVQFWIDKFISTVYFSNMYLVTHKDYPQIAADRQFVMSEDTYTIENNHATYKPGVLADVFKKFIKTVG